MINIQDIIPFMKKGWVAMNKCGEWIWFENEPKMLCGLWLKDKRTTNYIKLTCFDIAPADDWTKSLIKVGGNGIKS